MSAFKEFANFILLNVANLAATYDRLLSQEGGDYAALPADSRTTMARRLIKTVAEACEAETPDPLRRLFEERLNTPSVASSPAKLPHPLIEIECLGQTLTPVVTNLEAGKFLWQALADVRRFLGQTLPEASPPARPKAEMAVASLSLDDKTRFLYYIVESSQVAQVALDEQARIQYINPFFCSLYGYQAEEVIGQHVSILSGENEPETHYLNLLKVAAGQDAWRGEDWRKRKDGSIFPASVTFSGIRDENGALIAYLDVSRDVTERRNVQDQLRQLSQVVEQSPTIVIITNTAGQIEYVNPKFCQMTGYTPAEVMSQNPNILKSGETSTKEYKQMWQIISSGQEWQGELHNKKKNGELYWVSSHISPIKDSAGGVTHYLAIQEDITERKQAEDQLRKLSRAVEQSANTVVITNIEGYIEYVNPKFTQTTGYTREEAIGQHTRILKSGVTSPEAYKKLWETISAGEEWQGEFCNKKKNGELYWEFASISPIKDEWGGITHFLAVKEDITYRKQTEATLTQERYLLRTLIDNIPDYIYAKDTQGRFILGNLAVAQVMGAATPNNLIGKTDFDFYPPEIATPYYADDLEIIRSGQSLLNKEERVLDPTGQMIWALTTKIPLLDDQGQITGLVGIGREITNYKRLELQLQGSLARLTRQIQAITQIAQQISGTLTLNDLFHQVVDLMQSQFGYYHAQIYTLVEGDMVLQAGTGEIGRHLKENGHQIPLSAEQSLVVRAVWEGVPVLVPDVSQEPTWLPNPLLPETKAELAVPITLGVEIFGVLDVQSDKVDGLSEEDQLLLMGLCGQIAIAIETRRAETERARLLEEVERRARREQTIREITERMRAANNLEQLVKITARELGQRLSAGHVVVELGLEPDTQSVAPAKTLSNNGH
ncbi:MAG: PAS domain S-box protein [Anaerolineales bacterium]|nr:PAS domain S-box protein [Anaerolineales bacterium]